MTWKQDDEQGAGQEVAVSRAASPLSGFPIKLPEIPEKIQIHPGVFDASATDGKRVGAKSISPPAGALLDVNPGACYPP